jgi:phospholipid/cholesterol/gamma-HCH transport system permease protein
MNQAVPSHEMAPSFRIERSSLHGTDDGGRETALRVYGELEFEQGKLLWLRIAELTGDAKPGQTVHIDMSGVESVDGGAMALLVHVRSDLQQHGVKCELINAAPHVQDIIHLYRGDVKAGRRKRRRPQSTLEQLGRATAEMMLEAKLVLAFFGQAVVSTLSVFRRPKTANWAEIMPTLERTGADAIPIVALINFLVGLVMAFQSAGQLQRFGANIFIADLIGISMTRELGPLMTAIVVCGRSGAAFAAELGSMKVNEEIDALRTMGFGPMRFLVLPRTLALMLVMPMLVLIADAMGIVGGMLVGVYSLDLTPMAYLIQLQKAVKAWDLYSGLIKAVVFGLAIAVISCQQGLATSGGAEGVGRRTTGAVVTTLFMLIVIDAIFTVFFKMIKT